MTLLSLWITEKYSKSERRRTYTTSLRTRLVADFIGESNILDGQMIDDYYVSFSGKRFRCLDSGFMKREPVDVVVRPEDVDVVSPERGMLTGIVSSVTFKGVHFEIIVDIGGFKWMIQTTDYVESGSLIGIYIEPDAIHVMKKSEFSGMFGDYSTFSEEMGASFRCRRTGGGMKHESNQNP